MEDTLGGEKPLLERLKAYRGLNPCFNGRYSRRDYVKREILLSFSVLILVLMEDTLGAIREHLSRGAYKNVS